MSSSSAANPQNGGTNNHHIKQQQPPPPLVRYRATRTGPRCPFGNAHIEFDVPAGGGCVWLKGASGRGKTTTALHLANLVSSTAVLRDQLDIGRTLIEWNEAIPVQERCGVLFQQTTLLDELTVAGNLALALQQHDWRCKNNTSKNNTNNKSSSSMNPDGKQQQQQLQSQRIKQLLDTVGLRYERDAHKRVTELSGGIGTRSTATR